MTATSAILSADQINVLSTAYDSASSQDQTKLGVWAPAYEMLYNFLTGAPVNLVDQQTLLWLRGARFVNANQGLFGSLIRDYTKGSRVKGYGDMIHIASSQTRHLPLRPRFSPPHAPAQLRLHFGDECR